MKRFLESRSSTASGGGGDSRQDDASASGNSNIDNGFVFQDSIEKQMLANEAAIIKLKTEVDAALDVQRKRFD